MADQVSIKNAFNGTSSKVRSAFYRIPSQTKLDVPIKLFGTEKDKNRITEIVNRTAKSKLGKETLEIAAKAGYSIVLEKSLSTTFGYCDDSKKVLTLNSFFPNDLLVAILAHEARHAGQNIRGTDFDYDKNSIKSMVMVTRAMEADAQRTACITAWELEQKGDKSVFKAFSMSCFFTITSAFKKSLNKTHNIDKASTAAFKAWYDNDRIKSAYEKNYLSWYLKNLEKKNQCDYMTLAKDYTGKEIADKICFNKGGKNYFTDDKAVLEKGKYIEISNKTMKDIKHFMKIRKEKHGLAPEKGIDKLPTYSSNYKAIIVRILNRKLFGKQR